MGERLHAVWQNCVFSWDLTQLANCFSSGSLKFRPQTHHDACFQWDTVAVFFFCTVTSSFFLTHSPFVVFTKKGGGLIRGLPWNSFYPPSNPLKRDPAREDWTPNRRRRAKIWREAVRKISAGKTEREREREDNTTDCDCVDVCMFLCVLADTVLFPWCQSPSGGWINEVGLTWGWTNYHSVCVCVVL